MEDEKRYNEDSWRWETRKELWLDSDSNYVLEVELNSRIRQLRALRDKCGIDSEDKDSESSKHISVLEKVLTQLGLEITP